MNPLYESPVQLACYENDVRALIPQVWAQEGVAILEENMVAPYLVHRDFSPAIARVGETVHTHKPGEFKIRRKTDGSPVAAQSIVATDIPVTLNQWFVQKFVVRDGEGSMAFKDLVNLYLRPAMKAIATSIDRVLLGRIHAYLSTPARRVGRLGNLTAVNAYEYAVELDKVLNINKAPVDGRNLVLSAASKASMLLCDKFVKANERGDGGLALRTARLGDILGFATYMDQNVNSIQTGADIATHTITEPYAAEYAGTQACAGIGALASVGEYLVVAGNDQPTWVSAKDTDTFTLNEGNKYATSDNAVATRYKKCAVEGGDLSSYPAGWSKAITVKSYTAGKAPQVGQMIAFGTTTRHVYTVIESEDAGSTCSILLDRPLEYAVADEAEAYPGPYGSLNMAFHQNALALVSRPLAPPDPGSGVKVGIAEYNGIGMRVLMQYDMDEGGTKVQCDLLAGVAVLDSALCVPLLG
jgi:hypothetical protein